VDLLRGRSLASARASTEAREDWLNAVHLPGCAPDLNAVEGAWSVMKSGLGNHAAATLDQLEAIVRTRLRNSADPTSSTHSSARPASPATHHRHRPWPFNLRKRAVRLFPDFR
jgi:hypothetical protein